jgi:predicted nucleotidyltransferase component of viral defense system
MFEFTYVSIIDNSPQTVKVDIKIEKTLQKKPLNRNIQAIYQDPISSQLFFQDHAIQVMDLDEIFAEKMRAALTRKDSAIRDFFDISYAKDR